MINAMTLILIVNFPFLDVEVPRRALYAVADLEGVQGVRSNPPLDPNYFIFMAGIKSKSTQ